MLLSMTLLSAVVFGTSAITPGPHITGFAPIDGFSNYNGASGKLIVTLSFDEAVVPGTTHAGIIGLYQGGQLDPIQISGTISTNLLTGSTVVINNKTVTITFNRTLTQGETYFVTISPDALADANGLYFAGLGNADYDVTIGDFTNPAILAVSGVQQFTPKDGSLGFALAGNLVAQFTEPIAFGAGVTDFANFALYSADGNVVEMLGKDPLSPTATPASGKVSILGDKLYFNPSADLKELGKYYVRIAPASITDVSVNANPYAGINDNAKWNFQAADITAPTVAFIPFTAAANVQQGQLMTVKFSDNRDGKVPTPFEIRKNIAGDKWSIGDDVSALVTFTENGIAPAGAWTAKYTAVNTITFAWAGGPIDKFMDHGAYVFGIKAASFMDEEGNVALAATSAFTAGDFIAPVMVTAAAAAGNSPAPNNVAADLETTKLFLQSTNTDASGNDVEVHYLIVASGAAVPTPAAVMAGPVLANVVGSTNIARGFATVDGAGVILASKTNYDVYFASKDHAIVPNTSTQADVTGSKMSVQTSDIVSPVPTAKLNTLSTTGVVLTAGAASVSSVKLDSPVTITFDENVIANTSNITVKYWNSALATPAWVTPSYTFAFDGLKTITITGTDGANGAAWKSLGTYQVSIDNNEITDVITGSGTPNPVPGMTYTFTAEDYTGPIAVFKGTALKTIIGVATTANLVIDLGEACTRADGTAIDYNNVFFRDAATGNIVPSTITVTGGQFITIAPQAALLDGNLGHNYTIELTASIIDLSGNPLGYYKGGVTLIGAPSPQMLAFTTADEQRPVLTFVPADGTTGLDNNANGLKIGVTINEVVKKANGDVLTASDANYLRSIVTVVKVSDNSPINFDITGNTATTFNVDLNNFITAYAANESYKVTVTGLFDAAGNAITANSTTFSIRDYTKPTITSVTPADGATLVGATDPIKITFSEPVVGIAGQLITLTRDDVASSWNFDAVTGTSISGNVVTLTGVPAFAELGAYHVTFAAGAFKDLVGNLTDAAITTATGWNWSAFDATKPDYLSLVPANGATSIAKPSSLVITFKEASGKVFAGPGSIYIREMGNTGIPDFTIPAQSTSVSIVNNVVTIAVNAASFKYNSDYWVEVDASAFRDASNNYFAGLVNNNTLWNFTIQADPKPYYVITSSVPLNNADNVALNGTVTLKFSEPVWITSPVGKYLTFRNAADGTAHSTVYFDSPVITWAWNLAHDALTVQHPDFLADRSYYVNVTTGTFSDAANQLIDPLGVAPGDLDTPIKWHFTTADLTAPVVSAITVNGTDVNSGLSTTPTGIAKDGKIVVTFSEPVTIATPASAVMLNGGLITYTATFAANVLTITPSSALASGATVTVDVVANQIFDKSTFVIGGNPLAAGTVGKFTVLDYINPNWDLVPTSANVAPGNNKFDITNISINEDGKIYFYAVAKGTFATTPSPVAVKQNATGSIAVLAADNSLSITGLLGDTHYDLYFVAEDKVPNLMDGTSVGQTVVSILDVKTADNVAPLLLTSFNTAPFTAGLAPADGAGCVATATTLKLKFNEAIGTIDPTKFWVRKVSDSHSVSIASVTVATDVVTIALTAPLAEVTEYYVEIDPSAIKDLAGNFWADYFYGNARWNFTTADETHPTVATYTPALGATDVAIAAPGTLTMVFSEPVAKNTTDNVFIDIYRVGSATPQERINVLSSAVTVSGKTVTINRSNIYASELTYYVVVPANAFTDLACTPNNFAGILPNVWTFTTTDVTSPAVVWTPANNSVQQLTSVAVTAMFVNPRQTEITGSTKYDALYMGGVAVANATDEKGLFTVTANGTAVTLASAPYTSASPATITLNVTGGLQANTTYVVTFTAPATLTDQKGNAVPSSMLTFSTVDSSSPVITFAPATDAVNVGVNSAVNIKFNKKIYNYNDGLVGVNHINFTPTASELTNSAYITFWDLTADVSVAYTVTVVTPGLEYNLVPTAPLASTHQFQVTWNANAATHPAGQLVYDMLYLNNNILNVPTAFATTGGDKIKFTSEDVVSPSLTALSPTNGLSPVSTTVPLVMTFDEKVVAGSGNIQIRFGNGQIFYEIPANDPTVVYSTVFPFTVTIGHPALDPFKTYYVIIPNGAITDASSNANKFAGFADNTKWAFGTDDGTAPTVLSYTPENGAGNIPVFSTLSLRFSKNVILVPGKNVVIYYNNGDPGNDGNAIEVIPITSPNPKVVVSGSSIPLNLTSDIITIVPSVSFDKLGTYYVRIDNGAVKDASGNVYAGINNNTTWAFTITDNTKPSLVSTMPVNNSVGIGSLPVLTMNFDRNVVAGIGNVKVLEYYYNPLTFAYEEKLIESMPVTSSQVVVNGAVVTVTPSVSLGDNQVYYVLIDNTAFTNTASSKDPWAGISDPFVWRFTTADNTAPLVAANPASGATMLNTFDVTLTFSEAVTGVDATSVTVTGGTVVLSTVTAGTVYKATVTAADYASVVLSLSNAIKDLAGNAFVAQNFTYTIGDNTPPTLVATPGAGILTQNVFTVNLDFNKEVTGVAAAVTVDNGATVTVTGSGKSYVASIKAKANSTVNLTVSNAVKDLALHSFAGAVFAYTTGDNTPPVVTITGPAAPIPTSFLVTFTFDKEVTGFKDGLTVDNGTIEQVAGSGKVYVVSIKAAEKAAVTITLATTIKDLFGNAFAGKAVTYTVGDFTPPTLIVTPPASPVATLFTVDLLFNKPVTGVLNGITVVGGKLVSVAGILSSGGTEYTVTVSALEQTTVNIVISDAITDITPSTNKFAGQTLTYTTGDFTKPELVSFSPNAKLADNYPVFKMTFTENVMLGTGGSLKVYKINSTTAILDIPITADMISGKDVVVSYTLAQNQSGLDKNTRYYVLVDGTALTDMSGNAFLGVSNQATWTFLTGSVFATAIAPTNSLEFKVYPNPFVEYVNVDNASMLSKVVVTNIAGQVVKEVVNPTKTIQLNELRSGIYFISLYDMDNVIAQTAKIVKR